MHLCICSSSLSRLNKANVIAMGSDLLSQALNNKEKPERVSYAGKVETGSYEIQPIDPALDQRSTHHPTWLFGIWLLAFIDRSNVANARIDGQASNLKLDGNKFIIALTPFYISCILVVVSSNWVVKYFRANHYMPGLLIAWGIVGMCTGFVKDYNGLLVCWFFLGLSEGGLLAGMTLYLSIFLPSS
ncbi:MAG: hypothetical protein Q9184_003696 [Pyrenodesmia sp. 2 TL-2023]